MRLYPVQNAVEIFIDVRIGRPIDDPAAFLKVMCSPPVISDFIGRRMGRPIDLNHQPGLYTVKIGNVRTDRMLTAKFVTVQATAPEPGPEYGFRIGHGAAKPPCKHAGPGFSLTHSPPSSLRDTPPASGGRKTWLYKFSFSIQNSISFHPNCEKERHSLPPQKPALFGVLNKNRSFIHKNRRANN